MSKFQIIDNIEVPAAAARNRAPGEFKQALDKLEVGQGFIYEATGKLRAQYGRLNGLGLKAFKVWAAVDADGNVIENSYGVKRIEDKTAAEAAAATATDTDGANES